VYSEIEAFLARAKTIFAEGSLHLDYTLANIYRLRNGTDRARHSMLSACDDSESNTTKSECKMIQSASEILYVPCVYR